MVPGVKQQSIRAAVVAGAAALVLALLPISLGTGATAGAREQGQPSSAVTTFPLQQGSVPGQLSARKQAKLPRMQRWANRVLAPVMDQPSGLLEVQIVSALYIKRVFRKRLGSAAADSALRISWRESRLLPNVVNDKNTNGTNDWGLFQLNDGGTLQYAGGTPDSSALRPRWNVKAAAKLIGDVGWGPWGGMLT
ncbi:MAG: hypothetical protein CMH41_00580 [Micrococcales bacterium]|nr:hypothetical protein [Micrococcales bacterium]